MALNDSGRKDLTRGNMLKNLFSFALPFMLANFLQALYGAVDLWVVGKFGGGKISVAAVANGSEVMHLVMSFIMGITTGATVLIGNFFGAGDKRNTSRSIGMTMSISALLGVISTLLMVAMSPLLAKALRTPAEALSQTVDYLQICSWGVFFIFSYNALAAIFRGFGNSVAPMIFVGIACVCNVIGDLLLVAYWDMGPAGAAWATIVSQALSSVFALLYLKYGNFGFKFRLPNFRIVWSLADRYLKIGLPLAIQGVLINISFLFIVSIVNAMGGSDSAPAAGYGIVNRFNGFAMLPAISFAMAMAAITAQNIGANKPVRAVKTLYAAICVTMLIGAVFLLIMQFYPEKIIAMFIDPGAEGGMDVIRHGVLYAKSFSWEYILVPIVFCTNGFFNGCGRAFFSMSNNLLGTFLVRVPVSWFFSICAGATLAHVGMAAPLASLVTNIISLSYLFSKKWMPEKRKINK